MRVVRTLFLAVVSLLAALAAAAAPKEAGTAPMAADNPFARPSQLSFELPPFDRIRDTDYAPAFEAGMREQLAEVAAIARDPQPATFENTIVALERSGRVLDRVSSVFFNLNSCNTDAAMQEVDTAMAPRLAAHNDAIFLDAASTERRLRSSMLSAIWVGVLNMRAWRGARRDTESGASSGLWTERHNACSISTRRSLSVIACPSSSST